MDYFNEAYKKETVGYRILVQEEVEITNHSCLPCTSDQKGSKNKVKKFDPVAKKGSSLSLARILLRKKSRRRALRQPGIRKEKLLRR